MAASLESVFNHLVLPVKVPDSSDGDSEAVGTAILTRVSKACNLLGKLSRDDEAEALSTVGRSLHMSQGIDDHRLDAKTLMQSWGDLYCDDLSIIRIAQQNAALLIRVERR